MLYGRKNDEKRGSNNVNVTESFRVLDGRAELCEGRECEKCAVNWERLSGNKICKCPSNEFTQAGRKTINTDKHKAGNDEIVDFLRKFGFGAYYSMLFPSDSDDSDNSMKLLSNH